MRCVACNRVGCDPCHVKSKGSGGDDVPSNLMPLCREHHTMQHKIGWKSFSEKYVNVKDWLYRNEWEFSGPKLVRRKSR